MSVYHQTTVVYGWEIGWDQYTEYDDGLDNELRQELGWRNQSVGDVVIVADGRSGEYCYLGIVVAATNSTRDGPQHFDDAVELSESPDSGKMMELGRVQAKFGLVLEDDPQHHVFTHVT